MKTNVISFFSQTNAERCFNKTLMTIAILFTLTGCGVDEAQTNATINEEDVNVIVEDTLTTVNDDVTINIEDNSTSTDLVVTDTITEVLVPIENISKEALGALFFNDRNLSLRRSMSCATCHNPNHAFIDDRDNAVNRAVSVGDDGFVLGDRNSPMLAYALFSPEFDNDGEFIGGQFFDGRSSNLVEQAKGPFLNEVEMQMPSESSVVERVLENDNYIVQMRNLYGENIFDDPSNAFDALADAIASFERSAVFSSFDSKLDRVRARVQNFTAQEAQGEQLFRDMRCASCHDDRGRQALFTNFRYENIGVPKNQEVRLANTKGLSFIDHGLLENAVVNDTTQDGRFKVPSLRNIAVTAPYMHNGKFQDLKTVIHFYNTRDVVGALNPETNAPWERAEVNRNVIRGNRVGNLGLNDAQEDAIVAYLRTLTDARFEPLNP